MRTDERTYVGWTICGHERYGTQKDMHWQMVWHGWHCATCKKNNVYFMQEWKPSNLYDPCRDNRLWKLAGIRKKVTICLAQKQFL
jgi:hypothetical protein